MVGFAFIDLFFKLIKYFISLFLFTTMKIGSGQVGQNCRSSFVVLLQCFFKDINCKIILAGYYIYPSNSCFIKRMIVLNYRIFQKVDRFGDFVFKEQQYPIKKV